MTTQQHSFLTRLEKWTEPRDLPPSVVGKSKDENTVFAGKLLAISSSRYGMARPLPSAVLQPV